MTSEDNMPSQWAASQIRDMLSESYRAERRFTERVREAGLEMTRDGQAELDRQMAEATCNAILRMLRIDRQLSQREQRKADRMQLDQQEHEQRKNRGIL